MKENNVAEDCLMRWTKKLSFFQKHITFIPIQHSIHQSLCVVINPGKIKDNTLNSQHITEITYVLLFDSYGSHDENDVLKQIKRGLNDAYKEKHPQDF